MSDARLVLALFTLGSSMLLAAVLSFRHRLAIALLALLSVLWVLLDQRFEGPTLIYITPDHGLSTADLIGVAGLLLAAAAWLWPVRQRSREASRSS